MPNLVVPRLMTHCIVLGSPGLGKRNLGISLMIPVAWPRVLRAIETTIACLAISTTYDNRRYLTCVDGIIISRSVVMD